MLIAIKFLHFLGLSMLLGGGIANGIILGKAGTSDDAGRAPLRAVQRRIGQVTFVGLLFLWVTGGYLVTATFGGWSGLPTVFWAKLVLVLILSISALAAQIYSIMAIFSGSRTPRVKVIRLTAITTLVGFVALLLATMAFGS